MEESFLQQLASHVLNKYKGQLNEVLLILPSRRAKIFLIEAFKQKVEGASWLPDILSMEDFIGEISSLHTPDQLDLIFEFYEVYKSLEGKNADGLDDFMAWANILLYDFNEIDRNLIDAKELFGFLNAVKAIENWNPDGEELTDFEKKYLGFWQKFQGYYDQFTAHLKSKGIAYQGLMYREAIGIVQKEGNKLLKQKYYCFAGFNALTPAEEELIQAIEFHRSIELLWDADNYYLEDPIQEAGLFLRKKKRELKDFKWIGEGLIKGSKEIKVYGMSGNIGQAKLLAELLSKDGSNPSPKNAIEKAIILADENLLLPVLESIPKNIRPLNITMGYPVNHSAFYTFFYSYLQLFQQSSIGNGSSSKLYYKDLFEFLETSFLRQLDKEGLQNAIKAIQEDALLYYSISSIEGYMPQSLKFLFKEESNLLQNMQLLVHLLKESGLLEDIEMEILYHFYKLFNRLAEIDKKLPLGAVSLMNIYRQFISKSQLAFVGEPLDGLQIMGVLESRTLDFKEIYICSLNEGVLPSGKSQNSLIPFHIKKKFNLPTHKEKDAIFAYHFYRLLQRAEKIHLIYNASPDVLKGGERSRFIEQLLHEVPQKNPNIKISEVKVDSIQSTQEQQPEIIHKNQKILEAITNKLKSGLSPSAINTFLQCPLDFYYRYVLGLREEETIEPEEEIEASLFGTLLHDSLEQLYKEYEGQLLDPVHLQQIAKGSRSALDDAFKKNNLKHWDKGKLKLVHEVCLSYLDQFFAMEIDRAKNSSIHLIAVEKELEWTGELKLSGSRTIELKLKGKIDRVEEYNGFKHIIDYKSGLVKSADLKAKDIETILEAKENKYGKQLQLLIYQKLYKQQSTTDNFQSGIISFRALNEGVLHISELENESTEDLLAKIIVDMLDEKKPFKHKEDAKYCKFCRDLQHNKEKGPQ